MGLMNIRNIVNIARVIDISALNRCLSYEKCNDNCKFFREFMGTKCQIMLWGLDSIAECYNGQLIKILNDFCGTNETCYKCILNTDKGCYATVLAYQASQRKRGIL